MKTEKVVSVNGRKNSEALQEITIMAMFIAIIVIMAFTPVGLIDLPLIKATLLHVPVIIGAIVLGPKKGAILGFTFGLTSLIKNTLAPSILSFAFTPFMPVPGKSVGSLAALLICFLPRILTGVVPYYVYKGISGNSNMLTGKSGGREIAGLTIGAISGALTNTILVMGLIYLIFSNAYAVANGMPVEKVLKTICGIVIANGGPEALVAAILTPSIALGIKKAVKH